jgi:hypothetical protein
MSACLLSRTHVSIDGALCHSHDCWGEGAAQQMNIDPQANAKMLSSILSGGFAEVKLSLAPRKNVTHFTIWGVGGVREVSVSVEDLVVRTKRCFLNLCVQHLCVSSEFTWKPMPGNARETSKAMFNGHLLIL